MPINKFLIWTSLGSLIWVIFLTAAGYLFGENYRIIGLYIDNFKVILKPLFVILILFLLIRFFKKNLKNNN